MDWAAKMFGLDTVFYNQSEVGGGVIQVRPVSFSYTLEHDVEPPFRIDDRFGFRVDSHCSRALSLPRIAPIHTTGVASDLRDDANTLFW